jgi:glycosyltransferase involved in cell wall biosynthesis
MKPFNVLVDARATQEGFKQHKQRGLGHYAMNLLERLPLVQTEGKLTYLVETARPIERSVSEAGIPLHGMETPRAESYVGQLLAYQGVLPRPLRESGCDFAHFLFHLDAPLFSPIPMIVTIPDLIPQTMKQAYSRKHQIKNSVQFKLESSIARRAAAIIAISEFTKQDVLKYMHIDPVKVRVVYLGVQERFFRPPDVEALARLTSTYHLPEQFILYIGGIDPRKNIPSLVAAWGELWKESRFRIPLVIAGKLSNQREYPALLSQIRSLGLEEHLILPGYIPDEDLPALLSAASVFAFPSLYEGFGLPVLQAMAAGCPVLTTRRSSIPEVAGKAVWYVEEGTARELASGLRSVLENRGKAVELSAEGKAQAAKFSWDRTARETFRVYEDVAENLMRKRK